MKTVYLKAPSTYSRAMFRVVDALTKYAPHSVEIVDNQDYADLVVLHTIDFPEVQAMVRQLQSKDREYAIIQYCLRSTQEPNTFSWMPLWRKAEVVWSYYDLLDLAAEDKVRGSFNFMDEPLGVDADVFVQDSRVTPTYRMFTSGYVADSESVLEAVQATWLLHQDHFHLGPKLSTQKHVTSSMGIPDRVLAKVYQKCDFVAGLRRQEGFELPAIEGFFCGARPVVYDRPHYRRWFDGLASFIPEAGFEDVVSSLVKTLATPHPVTASERSQAVSRFNWERIARQFWAHAGL